jgi:hypothetical protein
MECFTCQILLRLMGEKMHPQMIFLLWNVVEGSRFWKWNTCFYTCETLVFRALSSPLWCHLNSVYRNTCSSWDPRHCVYGVIESDLRHTARRHFIKLSTDLMVDCRNCNLCSIFSPLLCCLPVNFSVMVPSSGPLTQLTAQNNTAVTNWAICMKFCVDVMTLDISPSCSRVSTCRQREVTE